MKELPEVDVIYFRCQEIQKSHEIKKLITVRDRDGSSSTFIDPNPVPNRWYSTRSENG